MSYIIAMLGLSTPASGLRPSTKDSIIRCDDAEKSGEGCDDGGFEEHIDEDGCELLDEV